MPNITKLLIDSIKPPEFKDQIFYRDEKIAGFAVRVTRSGTISFIVEKRDIRGKVKRVTLGKYPEVTLSEARDKAMEKLVAMRAGEGPSNASMAKIKLLRAYNDYLLANPDLKPSTVNDYEKSLNNHLADWQDMPLLTITKEKVRQKHQEIGLKTKSRANSAMRLLRAIMNHAIDNYLDEYGNEIIKVNPVRGLKFYKISRRQMYIKEHQLSAWYKAVDSLHDGYLFSPASTARDYLLVLLFTGLRREEAACLKWEDVDLKDRSLTIRNTKNGNDHTLPLPDYLYDLFRKRKEVAMSKYVFAGSGKKGHVVSINRHLTKVIARSNLKFCLHDLRRTFATVADRLDMNGYTIKGLLNHSQLNDVTAGYIIADVERMRKSMGRITDYLLSTMDVESSNKIIDFKSHLISNTSG